jgi:hypothetical protein
METPTASSHRGTLYAADIRGKKQLLAMLAHVDTLKPRGVGLDD